MVTLISNPLGHKLSDSEIDAIITNDAGNAMVFIGLSHGLTTGDYVYIQSELDSYNGFKYVEVIDADYFNIKNNESSEFVAYIQYAYITYRVSVLDHGWQCVHLPIVYELESDISPNNDAEESYTPVTVISQSNEGGLTRLALSVAISDATVLSKIKLFGTGDLEGVYQIVTVYEDWNIVIDLSYDSANTFTGLQVIKYYDNYTINVKVWAGLETGHSWELIRPNELAATLQFTPDNNNRIKFSISEVLRSYINVRNNLTLDSLPNNLDFMVAFYIQYYETYDESDGEEVTTYIGITYTDGFIGHAVNAKLPFKSESISFLSEYVDDGSTNYAKWLTLQEIPILVVDRFFDLSFINQYNGRDIIVDFERFLNGLLVSSETVTYAQPGSGVLRIPVTAESGVDEVCLVANIGDGVEIIPAETLDLSTFLNYSVGSIDWALGSNPSWSHSEMDILYVSFPVLNGSTTTFHYRFMVNTLVGGGPDMVFRLTSTSPIGSGNSGNIPIPSIGEISGDLAITATSDRDYLAISFNLPGVDISGFIISIGYGDDTVVVVPGFQITERICLDVIEECDSTFIETEDIRLTEDGDFRILE